MAFWNRDKKGQDAQAPEVVRRGTGRNQIEVTDEHRERVAATSARLGSIADLTQQVYDRTYDLCADLLQNLMSDPEIAVPAPLAERDIESERDTPSDGWSSSGARLSRRQSQLEVRNKAVAAVLSQYDELSFTRMRCYVLLAPASLKVKAYDIMVPTWNGNMLFDPARTWGGAESQWLGFRPSTGPSNVPVVPVEELPLTDASSLPYDSVDLIKKALKGASHPSEAFPFKIKDHKWSVSATISADVCRQFIINTQDLREEVDKACGNEREKLLEVLGIATGQNLELDSSASRRSADEPAAPEKPAPTTAKPAPRQTRSGGGDIEIVN